MKNVHLQQINIFRKIIVDLKENNEEISKGETLWNQNQE
jgi:hypothetical protein